MAEAVYQPDIENGESLSDSELSYGGDEDTQPLLSENEAQQSSTSHLQVNIS